MEGDNILNVSEPRDAFMFMLLERINKLEDNVEDLKKNVIELQERNKKLIVQNDKFQTYQSIGGVKLAIGCSRNNIDDAKNELEQCINLLVDKLGDDNILSMSAVITLDDFIPWGYKQYTRLYINFKKNCWISELVRLIEDIAFPEHLSISVCVDKGMIRYGSHTDNDNILNAKGIGYSLFDIDGEPIQPVWTNWQNSFVIHRTEYEFSESSDISDDESWITEPVIEE